MKLLNSYFDFYNFNLESNILFSRNIFTSNFYILFSLFFNLIINDNGGAIYVNNVESKSLIELTTFYKCIVNNGYHGGGIYFNCINGQNNLNKVCGVECESSSSNYDGGGHLFYSRTSNNYLHQILFSSISQCTKNSKSFYCSYLLINGKQIFKNSNSSNNYGMAQSGGHFRLSNELLVKYSVFSNNKVSTSSILFSECSNSVINYCNLLQNQSPDGQGVYYSYIGSIYFLNCYFMENTNYLFHVYGGGQIYINTSFIFHPSNSLSNGIINFGSLITYNFYQTCEINLFATYYCQNKEIFKSFNKIKLINFNIFYIIYSYFEM